jgi:tRNA G46 methylase TrmB
MTANYVLCSRPGRFVERMRNEDPGVFGERYNYIGMEIWEPLVTAANERASTLGGPRNLYYMSGNAKISLERLNVPNLRRIR